MRSHQAVGCMVLLRVGCAWLQVQAAAMMSCELFSLLGWGTASDSLWERKQFVRHCGKKLFDKGELPGVA